MSKTLLILYFIFSTTLALANENFILQNRDSFEPDYPTVENIEGARKDVEDHFTLPEEVNSLSTFELQRNYSHLDPKKLIPTQLLKNAVNYYDANYNSFKNKNYISIVDFSARSNFSRFFIVNMNSGAVSSFHVAHGSGGDLDNDGFVEKLSNLNNSHMSSRGYYKVSEIYSGKYGRSIRLDGLSSTNSNVRARAIVIHGADYVKEGNYIQGRSWGCFALSWEVKDDIVSLINGGSLLYAEKSKEI